MAWGTPVTESLSTVNTTEQEFTTQFSLAPTDSLHFQISGTATPGGTDGLNINVYSTVDDATWDSVPLSSMQLTTVDNPDIVSMIISGVVKVKIGVASAGATDTFTTVGLVAAIGTP